MSTSPLAQLVICNELNTSQCPGRSAARSGALQNRDRYNLHHRNGPGSALHRSTRAARCTAAGTRFMAMRPSVRIEKLVIGATSVVAFLLLWQAAVSLHLIDPFF